MEPSVDESDGARPTVLDLEPPTLPPAILLTGPPVPPQQRVYFYSSDEWEQFIREWATALEEQYVQIKLLGGPGDRGVDVAGFKTDRQFEGPWDCFQGKHYSEPLVLSDVLPEILKLFVNVLGGYYVMPDVYAFLAPQGCGGGLDRLLSKPTDLKQEFLDCTMLANRESDRAELTKLAEKTDFTMFRSVQMLDALEAHRHTPYHVARFGGPLLPRPEAPLPPEELASQETRYVAQLVEVYEEQAPDETFVAIGLSSHPEVGEHFRRQRFAFYQAEALRLYARDAVPEGTFEFLQRDVLAGVIEVAELDHAHGMARLSQVLTTAGQLELGAHTLISVATVDDRKGVCHQLANEDRLTWVRRSK